MTTDFDGHRYFMEIGDGGIALRVHCPWGANSNYVERVCWPHAEDGTPDPAPQPVCAYQTWAENLSWDEILHGSFTLELGCMSIFNGDSLELHLRRVVRSWVTSDDGQQTLQPIDDQRRVENTTPL